MLETPNAIIYIGDKTNLSNNRFEKKLVKKLESSNLLKNTIYIDKEEINSSLEKTLEKKYSYNYNKDELPIIIVINDGKTIQKSIVCENSMVETIINYEVFEW